MMVGLPAKKQIMIVKKFLFPFLIILFSSPSFAALETLVKEFQKTKDKMEKSEIEQRKLLGSLFTINRSIKKIVTEKSSLDSEKIVVEAGVKELAAKIIEIEKKSKEQKSKLRERLAVIYKLGGAGIARVLFTSSSSAQLERNLKILGVVAKTDIQLIKDYTLSQKDLVSKKVKLTKRWEKLKKIEAKIAKKEDSLLSQNRDKMQVLESVKRTQKTAIAKMKQIRNKSRQLASMDEEGVLDLLFQPSFSEKKGQLPAPIEGQLSQGYGLLKDNSSSLIFTHRGHLYTTNTNSPVQAVFDGTVAFVGQVAGYGQTVILDHGDHYYSVYSHLEHLNVSQGEQVKGLQKIAVSGDIDSSKIKGLYFEIRHFSEPSDPKLWVKGT